MTSSSNNFRTGILITPIQMAVNLCDSANAVNETNPIAITDFNDNMPGWTIVWNGKQTNDANYAFIATDPDGEIYALAIRGSLVDKKVIDWNDFANWVVEDFDVLKQVSWPYATTPNAKISNGASIGFTNLINMEDLVNPGGLSVTDFLVNNAIKTGKKVIITGHSLGGNIANVFTSYFISTLTQASLSSANVSLFTFAAPAPGNGDFAKDLDAKLPTAWHYQSLNDAIPNFPVPSDIRQLKQWYSPHPAASAITYKVLGIDTKLTDTIEDIATLLTVTDLVNWSNYRQQTNNYIKFPTELNGNHIGDNVGDWFDQALIQHQLYNYAGYLGVKLTLNKPASQLA